MATIEKQRLVRGTNKTQRAAGSNKALAYLSEIMAASAGSTSGQDALSLLNSKTDFDDDNLIGHGPTTPIADESAPWIYFRSDAPKHFFLKERSGSPGSYTYQWLGPFFIGDYQLRFIYSAAENPATPTIGWNALNQNFNITGGDWAVDTPNAKWFHVVGLPATSNTEVLSPRRRVDDPTASDISYIPSGSGNIPSSATTMQEAMRVIDDLDLNTGSPAPTTTENSWIQVERFTDPTYSLNPARLENVNSYAARLFNIQSNLITYSSDEQAPLFLEAFAKITTQANSFDLMRFRFEALTSTGTSFPNRIVATGSIQAALDTVTDAIRISGNIPIGTTSVQLRVTVEANSGGMPSGQTEATLDSFKIEVRNDINADEVIIDRDNIGNNIVDTGQVMTVDETISQIDSLPIQPTDFEDLEFPPAPNGIDDDGVEVRQMTTIHRNIQNLMNRPTRTYMVKLSYKSAFTGSPTDGRTVVNFTHNVYTDANSNARISTEDFTGQTATATDRSLIINLPTGASVITVGFVVATGQADARLLITDYDLDIIERVTASDVSVDASGFSGNLETTDDDLQKVAEKVDGLAAGSDDQTASEVSIVTTNFSNPSNFPGGLLNPLATGGTAPGVTNAPTNVQQALTNADYIFSRQFDPYQYNQTMDRPDPPTNTKIFDVNNSNTHRLSNPVDVPAMLRELDADLNVTVRVKISAISTGFIGNIKLRNSDNSADLPGTASNERSIDDTEFDPGDHVEFERTLSHPVPNTFRVRFERTSSGNSATLTNIIVYISEVGAGGAGGQGSSEPEIIWEAGATTSDRTTAVSASTNYNLDGNRRFDQYSGIVIWYDTDATAGAGLYGYAPEPAVTSMITNHGTAGRVGLIILEAFSAYKLIKPVTQTSFRIYEGSSSVGIRKIYGIP